MGKGLTPPRNKKRGGKNRPVRLTLTRCKKEGENLSSRARKAPTPKPVRLRDIWENKESPPKGTGQARPGREKGLTHPGGKSTVNTNPFRKNNRRNSSAQSNYETSKIGCPQALEEANYSAILAHKEKATKRSIQFEGHAS